jgi:single-stranded-DNA-specific exonuclease
MKIQKRNDELYSIKDVILSNTGLTEEELFNPTKEYEIDKMPECAKMIKDYLSAAQKVTVVGDYDADGICASAILKLMFKALGTDINVRLPKRFSEGYGLSTKIVDEIESGLLITVDNGIVAFDAIDEAKAKGLGVIVLDHHLGQEDGALPNADIVIDPNAIEGSATFSGYCGAGLAFKLAVEMLGEKNALIPKLRSLAAIATVADVMKLTEDNRKIVKQGMEDMLTYKGRTTGLGAVLEKCGINKYLTAKDIGFKIGPMINAAGRMLDDGANISYDALSYNSTVDVAKQKADELFNLNEQRKVEKEKGIEMVKENIEDNCLFYDKPLIVYQPGLPEGLVGIFAGSLAEEMQSPCFVFTDSDDPDLIKGSGRTYGGVNIKEMLDASSHLIKQYGGHAEAAGVTLEKALFEDFRNSMIEAFPEDAIESDVLYYDLDISPDEIEDVMNELDKYAPYGEGNPEIVFYIKGFKLSPGSTGYYRTMGSNKQHIKLLGNKVSAVGFNMTEKYQVMGEPKTVDLVGTISRNYYMGKFNTQIEIIDFQESEETVKKSPMAMMLEKAAAERYK